jgi:O-antigen/teichoic acid export membrane protein
MAMFSHLRSQVAGRLGLGVADQAVSSLTNFAVVILVARSLSAVQFGAFSLAYVTYGFMLNGSRGLASYPLQVRFSGTDLPTWRRAVASSTATAAVVGLATGACVLVVGTLLGGTTRPAFVALGLTLPGLLLQDSWRYAFFVLGRGGQALLNDLVWAAVQLPALFILQATGHANVFLFVFAWGAAAAVAAAVGPFQARVIPRLTRVREWVSQHRDLGPRYVASGLTGNAAAQLRAYGVGIMLGLAAVGYLQAVGTLMGPFMIIFYGIGLVTVPEAARLLRRSPRRLPLFCLVLSGSLAAASLAWGVVLLVALPRGVGSWLLGPIWQPTYPLVLPQTLVIMGQGVMAGAATGLGALGAARRSLRGIAVASIALVVCSLLGAYKGGATGAVVGTAVAAWIAVPVLWWQLHAALRESSIVPAGNGFWLSHPAGQHRKPGAVRRRRHASRHRSAPQPGAARVDERSDGMTSPNG